MQSSPICGSRHLTSFRARRQGTAGRGRGSASLSVGEATFSAADPTRESPVARPLHCPAASHVRRQCAAIGAPILGLAGRPFSTTRPADPRGRHGKSVSVLDSAARPGRPSAAGLSRMRRAAAAARASGHRPLGSPISGALRAAGSPDGPHPRHLRPPLHQRGQAPRQPGRQPAPLRRLRPLLPRPRPRGAAHLRHRRARHARRARRRRDRRAGRRLLRPALAGAEGPRRRLPPLLRPLRPLVEPGEPRASPSISPAASPTPA